METTQQNIEKKNSTGFWQFIHDIGEHSFGSLLYRLPFIFFLIAIGGIHIYNAHMAETFQRSIALKQKELKELRWEYACLSAKMMKMSRQSVVAGMVSEMGLEPLRVPPHLVEE
ncbi:MAG: FtsL-like putative cell division protein [Chitinophagales bacterium]|nr:FtsL-like putative cell division protein [Chitinophagales bacterium]MDW8274418.1 FtsL-like putative cell division protein [Chitinophagales bacterium]